MIAALLPLLHLLWGSLSLAWGRRARAIAWVALLGDVVLLGLLWPRILAGSEVRLALGGWGPGLGIAVVADKTALWFTILLVFLEGGVLSYLRRTTLAPVFFMLLHLLLGAALALLFSRDLFNIYVILELLTFVSYLLVGYERRSGQIWAGLKYLILASVGMNLYLLGVAVVYYHTGTLDLTLLSSRLPAQAPWIPLAAALLAGGIAVKAGIFLYSLWLPRAHASAPPAVSALLSGLVIKMGIVVLLRLAPIFPLRTALLVLAGLTGVAGILYAYVALDLKRILAFHTLSQIGYLLFGIGLGTPAGLLGATEYAVSHGLFKALLFLAAGTAVNATGQRAVPGLIRERHRIPRSTRLALLIGTLGIVGLPPLAGFCGKATLCADLPSAFLLALPLLFTLGTALSFSKLVPLFILSPGPSAPTGQATAYAVLGLPILLFLPAVRPLLSATEWAVALHPLPFAETIGAIVLGALAYRFFPSRRLPLPRRLFRLEEAILTLLAGVLFILVLCLVS